MASQARSSSHFSAPHAGAPELMSQACRQLAQATEAAAVCSGCVEGLQHVHHRSAQRATLRLTQVAEHMRSLNNPLEFFGLQSILMHCLAQDMGQLYQDMSHLLQHTTENTLRLQGMWLQAQSPLIHGPVPRDDEPEEQVQDEQEASESPSAPAAYALNAATQAASAATAALLQSWTSMMARAPGMASGHPPSRH